MAPLDFWGEEKMFVVVTEGSRALLLMTLQLNIKSTPIDSLDLFWLTAVNLFSPVYPNNHKCILGVF